MEQDVLVLPDGGDGVRVIACSGDFDQASLEPLRQACAPAVAHPAVRRIVLDVSRITFADSAMLNEMLHLLRTGRLVLAGPLPRSLVPVLELTMAGRLFAVADTVEEARTL
ncbi:STAS domain-containing protein [Streptomyces sp. NPDC058623]|uniref:STAS domain-containing protein n=1 Tax=Streptomyces sp. NPDC058623 TaxID=3346563 RepID=UPI00365E054F